MFGDLGFIEDNRCLVLEVLGVPCCPVLEGLSFTVVDLVEVVSAAMAASATKATVAATKAAEAAACLCFCFFGTLFNPDRADDV